jgi:2,4-dienoyl-CoA reductase-like NADH-dependent reductase (Old Yellow Enzyme family)
MIQLFEPVNIGTLTLKNRAVRSATWTGMAEKDGGCSKRLATLTEALARGGVGLIITGFAYVMPNGQALPGQLGIHEDGMIPRLKELTRRVHDHGGKIAMQIAHAGAQTTLDPTADRPVWGPSAVYNETFKKMPKAMTQREIKAATAAFAKAAERVRRAGFDAVQLHAAHGYLVSQFLSPATNKRKDIYGGSIENRGRFLFQIYGAVRKAVGKDFPVMVKLNVKDFVREGLNPDDAVFVARTLDQHGIDAIETSGGTPASGALGPARTKIDKGDKEAYFMPLAKKISKQVAAPVILVGGIRSLNAAKKILDTKSARLISMSRPFIREPDLVKRWEDGSRRKADCISCNLCFRAAMSREGVYCMVLRRAEKKATKPAKA